MKNSFGVIAALTIGLSASASLADTQVTTIESRVVAVPSNSNTSTTYKVIGPNQMEYVIEGPPDQVALLASRLQKDPSTVVHFDGNVVEGPTRTFHVTRWQEVKKTESTTTSPSQTVRTTTTETTTR